MDGGNGKIVSLLERMATTLDALREGQEELRAGQDQLRLEMRHGFEQVNKRIDNAIDFMGGHHGDHEKRIRVLEERVLGKPKPRRKN